MVMAADTAAVSICFRERDLCGFATDCNKIFFIIICGIDYITQLLKAVLILFIEDYCIDSL